MVEHIAAEAVVLRSGSSYGVYHCCFFYGSWKQSVPVPLIIPLSHSCLHSFDALEDSNFNDFRSNFIDLCPRLNITLDHVTIFICCVGEHYFTITTSASGFSIKQVPQKRTPCLSSIFCVIRVYDKTYRILLRPDALTPPGELNNYLSPLPK